VDQLDSAIHVYDSIRRPRAQGVVRVSREVGMAYYLLHPDFGNSLKKITEDANRRLPLVWYHDLDGDLKRAEQAFFVALRTSDTKDAPAVTVLNATAQSITI
jgi:salicylate hydroxylase